MELSEPILFGVMEGQTAARFGDWALAISGAFLALLVGAISAYVSVKKAKGPRERALMVRAGTIGTLSLAVFVGAQCLLPAPWQTVLWVAYVPALVPTIQSWNRKQFQVRREEGTLPEMATVPRGGFRKTSRTKLLGLPLYDICFAPSPDAPTMLDSAKGIFACGLSAKGLVAIGVYARGVVAIGVGAYGFVSLGVIAAGLLAAAGVGALAPIAFGGTAVGIVVGGVSVFGWKALFWVK